LIHTQHESILDERTPKTKAKEPGKTGSLAPTDRRRVNIPPAKRRKKRKPPRSRKKAATPRNTPKGNSKVRSDQGGVEPRKKERNKGRFLKGRVRFGEI